MEQSRFISLMVSVVGLCAIPVLAHHSHSNYETREYTHLEGTVAAAVMLAFFEGIMASFFDPTMARIGSLCLMSIVLLIRPHGIFAGAVK